MGQNQGGASAFVPLREFLWGNNPILRILRELLFAGYSRFLSREQFLILIHLPKKAGQGEAGALGLVGFVLSWSSLAGAGGSAPPQASDHRTMELFGLEKTQGITLDPAQRHPLVPVLVALAEEPGA